MKLTVIFFLSFAFGFVVRGNAFPPQEQGQEGKEALLGVFDQAIHYLTFHENQEKVPELIGALEELREVYRNMNEEEVRRGVPDDTFRTIPEVIKDKGYPAEQHTVETSDGYRLKIFRIPGGRGFSGNDGISRPPILLSHGLIDSAGGWIVNYANQSLPYLLADAGYDVFLGNIRGNKYGEDHKRYGRYDPRLWDLSFDEQGKYDVPATLDYIIKITGFPKVALVGHSQGCTQFFASLYFTPSVADKVSIFFALAPALYFDENTNTLIQLAANLYLAELLETFMNKFLPIPEWMAQSIALLCHTAPKTAEFLIGLLCGQNPGEFNYDRMAVMCYQSLGMTSTRNMVHWAQMVRTEEFKAHDFGYTKNLRVYGSGKAPTFVVEKIYPKNVPIAVFYGAMDELATASDVENVISHLPVDPIFVKNVPQYAHLDLTWGKNAVSFIYEDLIMLLKKHVPA